MSNTPSGSFIQEIVKQVKIQNSCIYPTRIKHASTKPHANQKGRTQNCAHILRELNMQAQILYNTKIVHISYRNLICRHRPHTSQTNSEYRNYAHILGELNMQAHHTELVHIFFGNWICMHSWKEGRHRDQGQPEKRGLLEQAKIEMED